MQPMNPVLCALIRISYLSLGQVAEHLALLKSNLLSAIIGKRALPERVMATLFPILELIPNGTLRMDIVHRWHMRSLEHLPPLLGDGPLGSVVLHPLQTPRKSAQRWDHWLLCSSAGLYGIVRGREAILGERTIPYLRFGAPITIEDPTACWTNGIPKSIVPMLLAQISDTGNTNEITWEDVAQEAERRLIGPEQVMHWLRSERPN